MSKLTLEQLRKHANDLGLNIETDHIFKHTGNVESEGYWLHDQETGQGPWEDENFSTSLQEVAGKLVAYELQFITGASA